MKWIPVSERLPEKTGWYLVCFARQYNKRYKQTVTVACWFPNEWSRNTLPSTIQMPATHWMPLPDPPEVEDE